MKTIETRVAGIPAVIEIESWSDDNGYIWSVCDSRGRHAPWLERKLTSAESRRIEDEIQSQINAYNDDMRVWNSL